MGVMFRSLAKTREKQTNVQISPAACDYFTGIYKDRHRNGGWRTEQLCFFFSPPPLTGEERI